MLSSTRPLPTAPSADPAVLWHAFLDSLSDPLLMIDAQLRITRANAAARRRGVCKPGMSLAAVQPALPPVVLAWVRATVDATLHGGPSPGTGPAGFTLNRLGAQLWALCLTRPAPSADTTAMARLLAEVQRLRGDSPFPMLVLDAQFRIVDLNPALERCLGRPRAALLGIDPASLAPPEDLELWQVDRELNAVGDPLAPDAAPPAEGGPADPALSCAPDAPEVLTDRAVTVERIEPAWVPATADATADGVPADDPAHDPVDHRAEGDDAAPAALTRHATRERRLFDAHGRERWFRVAAQRMTSADEQHFWLLDLQDCTAEHAASAQAERARHELDQWFELSPVGMLAFDGAGLVLRSNRVFESLVGRVPVLLGEAPDSLRRLLGWTGPGSLTTLAPGAESPERRGVIETVAVAPSAPTVAGLPGAPTIARRPVRARVRCIDIARPAMGSAQPRYIAVVEGLEAEQALDQAQAQWGALVDAAGLGVALDRVGRDLVQPDSMADFESLQRAVRDGRAAQARYAIRHPSQGLRWLLTRVEPREGAPPSVVTLDVTEQERARARNDELLRELTSILESSSAGIAFLRGNTLARCNARFERMLGFAAGAVAGCSVRELLASHPQADQIVLDIESALADAGVFETEIEIHLPGKAVQWAALSARRIGPLDAGGGQGAVPAPQQPEVVAVLTDITRLKRQHAELERLAGERERTEAAMSQQAELTRAILDSVFVGIVTVGPNGIEWMNRSARRMFGGGLATLRHAPLSRVATSDPGHPFRKAEALLTQRGHAPELPAVGFECRVEALDGRSFWVVGNVVASGDEDTPQLTYALLDIDRRREAEARSAQAQASLQRVIELAPLAIALFDAGSGTLRHLNPVAAELAGVSPDDLEALIEPRPTGHSELLGLGELPMSSMPEDLPPPLGGDAVQDDLRAALERARPGEPICREVQVQRGGQAQVWDARYLPLAEPGQAADQVLMVATDVTAQRAAEAARLEAAIAQREMLVKEVHHRIKNNLQGVAGLLSQIAQRRPEVATVLREAVGQVQAIALVYGLQVGGRGPLRLASLLESIAGALQRSSGRPIGVALRTRADTAAAPQWALPEAEAIPVALTLNELLSNALRHGGPGPIECLLISSDDEARLEIRNEGRLPDGFSLDQYASGVLGLGLVRALLPRRSATLSLGNEGGRVLACVSLRPPSLTRMAAPAAATPS